MTRTVRRRKTERYQMEKNDRRVPGATYKAMDGLAGGLEGGGRPVRPWGVE